MIKLKEVTIHKYKSFESEQTFPIEEKITTLVGMNESGKSSVLEAISKSNYFEEDSDFEFDMTHDYPRREKKSVEKSGEDPKAITIKYEISESLIKLIEGEFGEEIFNSIFFKHTVFFSNESSWELNINYDKIIKYLSKELPKEINLHNLINSDSYLKYTELLTLLAEDPNKPKIGKLSKYFKNEEKWENPIEEFIVREFLKPHQPKFLYYDEYYSLPSRVSISDLQSKKKKNEELKTAKALFELADINIDEIVNAENYEDFKAELEATEAIISDELFKYWKTNNNLSIEFEIDKVIKNTPDGTPSIVDHVLDIRVKNSRFRVSLPLRNRSKGFNWFFSFLVWFKRIQEDTESTYVILLDEPGLNLHASAQADLLKFLEDLSENYQIIYSTHSPFMIDSQSLTNVRTVVETQNGSRISDSIQEKDPNTLFPLQAALGYNIAQNLFVSKYNLLVEGVSDLTYLQLLSSILESAGREGLNEKITIVPVGGLDKVATFISLLRGNDLKIACLLDTFRDSKGDAKLKDLIEQKIISDKRIKFFHEFLNDYTTADIEDLFSKEDYLDIYNLAFPEKPIKIGDLNDKIKPTILQITKHLGVDRFNHYKPASVIGRKGLDSSNFSDFTLTTFEKVFSTINRLFQNDEN